MLSELAKLLIETAGGMMRENLLKYIASHTDITYYIACVKTKKNVNM